MILIGYGNITDTATLSSTGTFEALLPLANLQNTMLADVARTTTDAAFSITALWSAKHSVGVVALDNCNVSASGTIRVQCYDGATLKDDSNLIKSKGERFWFYVLPSEQVVDSVMISIDSTTNANDYIELGRVFIGKLFQPKNSPEYGEVSQSVVDLSEITSTPSGVKFPYAYATLRNISLAWKYLTDAESLAVLYLQRTHGKTKELVFIRQRPIYINNSGEWVQDDLSAKLSFMGNAEELTPLTNPFFGATSGGFSIREIGI